MNVFIVIHYAGSGNNAIGFILVIFFIGLLLVYRGIRKMQLDRLIENMDTAKIGSVAMGLAELYGTIYPYEETLIAPLSGNKCVYCRVSVSEWKRGRKRIYLKEHRAREKGVLFYLEDDTGKILVDARGADLTNLTRDVSIKLDDDEEITDRIKEYCHIHSIPWQNRDMEFEETFIEPGEDLYVMGTVQPISQKIFNEEHKIKENIMVGYTKGQHIYYISDKSEKELLQNSISTIRFMILSGSFLLLLGLFMFISQLK